MAMSKPFPTWGKAQMVQILNRFLPLDTTEHLFVPGRSVVVAEVRVQGGPGGRDWTRGQGQVKEGGLWVSGLGACRSWMAYESFKQAPWARGPERPPIP